MPSGDGSYVRAGSARAAWSRTSSGTTSEISYPRLSLKMRDMRVSTTCELRTSDMNDS